MPNENEQPVSETETEKEATKETAAPSYVTPEQLKSTIDPLQQTLNALNTSMQALAAARNAPMGGGPIQEHLVDPTDEEIAAEAQEGKFTKLHQKQKNMEARIKAEMDTKFAQGTGVLAGMAKKMAVSTGEMPYYTKYAKEIDAQLSQLPLQQQADPAAYKYIHDFVVGGHMPEILKEETEKAIRNSRDKGEPNGPGANNGRLPDGGDKAPSVESLIGKDAADTLKAMGRTEDEFAKHLGYKSWADYAKVIQTQHAEA